MLTSDVILIAGKKNRVGFAVRRGSGKSHDERCGETRRNLSWCTDEAMRCVCVWEKDGAAEMGCLYFDFLDLNSDLGFAWERRGGTCERSGGRSKQGEGAKGASCTRPAQRAQQLATEVLGASGGAQLGEPQVKRAYG